jgi:hypothetical protein
MSAAEAGLHIPEGVPTNITGEPTEGRSYLLYVTRKKNLPQQIRIMLFILNIVGAGDVHRRKT